MNRGLGRNSAAPHALDTRVPGAGLASMLVSAKPDLHAQGTRCLRAGASAAPCTLPQTAASGCTVQPVPMQCCQTAAKHAASAHAAPDERNAQLQPLVLAGDVCVCKGGGRFRVEVDGVSHATPACAALQLPPFHNSLLYNANPGCDASHLKSSSLCILVSAVCALLRCRC